MITRSTSCRQGSGRSRCWMMSVGCSNRSASSRWNWSGSKKFSCSDALELRKLVELDHPELSISRQCALLDLPRSSCYYLATPVLESTLRIMAKIDALYLDNPCSSSRLKVEYLSRERIPISRDRLRNLIRR